LVRSCSCGASLLEEFVSRRDESGEGLAKRMEFSYLIQELRRAGVSRDEACEELRSVLHGVESELLETLGVGFVE